MYLIYIVYMVLVLVLILSTIRELEHYTLLDYIINIVTVPVHKFCVRSIYSTVLYEDYIYYILYYNTVCLSKTKTLGFSNLKY